MPEWFQKYLVFLTDANVKKFNLIKNKTLLKVKMGTMNI